MDGCTMEYIDSIIYLIKISDKNEGNILFSLKGKT